MSGADSAPPPSVLNAFTVDLEDWFQGLTSTNPLVAQWPSFDSRVTLATRRLLELLRTYNVQATFFILGYVADQYPELIQEVRDAGHEIASHGYYHRFVYKLQPREFLAELAKASDAIERACGVYPSGYRAPYFSVNAATPWVFEYIAATGLQYDASVFPTRNMLYGYPGAPRYPYCHEHVGIMEYPASTLEMGKASIPISGGFYVRLFPYALVRKAIQKLNAKGQPAIMYVHPWELDTGQDYPYVTARERITHYHGRKGLETKLRRMFSDFQFTTVGTLLQEARASC